MHPNVFRIWIRVGIAGGGAFMDFEESVMSPKVLQGQENSGFASYYFGRDAFTNQPDFEMSRLGHPNLAPTGLRKTTTAELMRVHPSSYAGFAETSKFLRVLQGQEICPLQSLKGKADFSLGAWAKPNASCTAFNQRQASKPIFNTLRSEGLQTAYFPFGDVHQTSQSNLLCSKPANFQRENAHTPSTQEELTAKEVVRPDLSNKDRLQDSFSAAATLGASLRIPNDETFDGKVNGCKLFGFSLSGEGNSQNLQSSAKRSCTKVSDDSNSVKL